MILISQDVFVDFLLYYNKGWQPLPWAYPDFKDATYSKDFEEIRKIFKKIISPDANHKCRSRQTVAHNGNSHNQVIGHRHGRRS